MPTCVKSNHLDDHARWQRQSLLISTLPQLGRKKLGWPVEASHLTIPAGIGKIRFMEALCLISASASKWMPHSNKTQKLWCISTCLIISCCAFSYILSPCIPVYVRVSVSQLQLLLRAAAQGDVLRNWHDVFRSPCRRSSALVGSSISQPDKSAIVARSKIRKSPLSC